MKKFDEILILNSISLRDLERLDLDLGNGKIDFYGTTVLDVGCGQGYHLIEILKRGGELLVGGDVIINNLRELSKKIKPVQKSKFFFTGFDAVNLPFKHGSFDIVICNLMLAYVENDLSVLKEISRVLKPGGKLLLRVTSLGFYLSRIWHEKTFYKIRGICSIISTILYHIIGVKIKKDTFHLPGEVTRLLKSVGVDTEELINTGYFMKKIPGSFNIIGSKMGLL